VEIKIGSSFQPVESGSKVSNPLRSPPASHSRPAPAASAGQPKPSSLPPLPKDVGVEKYSGLRLRSGNRNYVIDLSTHKSRLFHLSPVFFSHFRKPRVSSSEMDRKMADRRLIRLSQVPERLAREKLEDSDWVTFAVLVNRATPQSSSSVGLCSNLPAWTVALCFTEYC